MITNGENQEPSRFLFFVPYRPILVVRQGPWNMFQQSMQMKSTLASSVCPSDLGFRYSFHRKKMVHCNSIIWDCVCDISFYVIWIYFY